MSLAWQDKVNAGEPAAKPCRHRSRQEAMDCPFFRAHKAERIPPLHGPNEFTWQLSVAQIAIMSSLAYFDPGYAHVQNLFATTRPFFDDSPEDFAEELFVLRALGLVWVECDAGLVGYTAEGRAHMEADLAEKGTSLARLRLEAQATYPSTFRYGPFAFVDRITAFLGVREMDATLKALSVTGQFAHTETVQ